MKQYKVLTINPGSTSTKIALFEGENCLYSKNVSHDAGELDKFPMPSDQLPYRRDMILSLLDEAGVKLDDVDVFVGRGGGLLAMEGGTYAITDLVLERKGDGSQSAGCRRDAGYRQNDRNQGCKPHDPPARAEPEGDGDPAQQGCP